MPGAPRRARCASCGKSFPVSHLTSAGMCGRCAGYNVWPCQKCERKRPKSAFFENDREYKTCNQCRALARAKYYLQSDDEKRQQVKAAQEKREAMREKQYAKRGSVFGRQTWSRLWNGRGNDLNYCPLR